MSRKDWSLTAIQALALDPESPRLASASVGGAIQFWDEEKGFKTSQATLQCSGANAIDFSPTGLVLAVAQNNGMIRFCSTTLLEQFRAHLREVTAVRFWNAGQCLLSAGTDGLIKTWDVTNLEYPVHTFARHRVEIEVASICERANLVISGAADGKVALWDIRSGEMVASVSESHKNVVGVALKNDGTQCISCDRKGGAVFRDIRNKAALWVEKTEAPLVGLVASEDFEILGGLRLDQQIGFWMQDRPLMKFKSTPCAVGVSPDKSKMFVGLYTGEIQAVSI